MLRRQLDTLSRLASAALRMVGTATQVAADTPGILALEKALRAHGRVAWALRLIDALRARLTDDLARVERGAAPELMLHAETAADREAAAQPLESKPEGLAGETVATERGETRERPETFRLRGFGDGEFADILKRPTDEIIALICRELGLDPDWPRLAEATWEREEGQSRERKTRRHGGSPSSFDKLRMRTTQKPPPPRESSS